MMSANNAPNGAADSTAGHQQEISADYFGVNLQRGTSIWPVSVMRTVRDFNSVWFLVEPAKSRWDFSRLDSDISLAESTGSNPELIFSYTPTWASARPNEAPPTPWSPSGARAEPVSIDDWITYVTTVATRYKGRVHTYECWNEPDEPVFYSGDIQHLLQMCQTAYAAVKKVDPTITFTSPSFAAPATNGMFRSYLAAGGTSTFDVVSFHYYPNTKSPEAISSIVSSIRSSLQSYNAGNTPLWMTETGYYIASSPEAQVVNTVFPSYANVLDGPTSAMYVARTYLMGMQLGLQRVLWFAWGANNFAIVDDGGKTMKPATAAYSAIAGWLADSTFISSAQQDDGTWVFTLRSSSGLDEHIIWNESNKATTFTIPSSWRASTAVDLTGVTQFIASGVLNVTGMPILVQ
jgi:hypothetical protein